MKHRFPALLLTLTALAAPVFPAHSQDVIVGHTLIPDVSREHPGDRGVRMHTNFVIHVDSKIHPDAGGPPAGATSVAQLRSIYGLPSTGGAGTICIVDAYNYTTALADFNTYAKQYGLPVETSTVATASTNKVFQVVYGSGTKPRGNAGWNQEEALDIEISHAMAPNAKIVLVEASSATNAALFQAVAKANTLPGVKEVTMSFSGGETGSQTTYDHNFMQSGVVYFASTGDNGSGTGYPSTSPYVCAAGGTTLGSGTLSDETGWSGSGGGLSSVYGTPSYQAGVTGVVGSKRGVPDLSYDADPNTGVAVYCSKNPGWAQFGGTSVSSPALAGIENLNGSPYASTGDFLTELYGELGTSDLYDVTSGSNGGFSCKVGYDLVTGVGTPRGLGGM